MQLITSVLLIAMTMCQLGNGFPAELLFTTSDNAFVTLSATADNQYAIINNRPELLEYVEGSLDCESIITDSRAACIFDLKLKKNGPIDFTGVDTSLPIYGYASRVEFGRAEIDLNLFRSTPFHIAEVLTAPVDRLDRRGSFLPLGSASVVLVSQNDDFFLLTARFFDIAEQCDGCAVQYQNFQLLGSGIRSNTFLVFDTFSRGDGFIRAEGNRGVSSFTIPNNLGIVAWLTDRWSLNQPAGHYTALRFLINSNVPNGPGKDLSVYSTLRLRLGCIKGMVVEVFLGWEHPGGQNYLGDILCDDFNTDFDYQITGIPRTNINSIMLHIPASKNQAVANQFRLFMNVFTVRFIE